MLPYIPINELRHMNARFKAFSKKVSTNQLLGSGTIDKIEILTNDIDSDYLNHYWKKSRKSQNPNWNSVVPYKSNNGLRSIVISSNSGTMKPFFGKLYTYKISLNPTMFNSFENLHASLEKIIDLRPWKHKIHRADLSSVLPLDFFPVSTIHEYLYFPEKQAQAIYKSDDIIANEGDYSGFTFGQNPECLSCYNVEFKLRKMKQNESKYKPESKINIKILDHKTKLTAFRDQIINIELQLSGKKLNKYEIQTVSDLPKLINAKPFSHLKFYDFYKIDYHGKKNAQELLKLILLMKTRGYNTGRKFYDRHNNFDRYGKHIPELILGRDKVTMNHILNQSFQIGMERFFK